MAKVRLPDPLLTERLGEPRFLFLWLTPVSYDSNAGQLLGQVFEIPEQLRDVYPVGLTVTWKPNETYDWSVNDDGHLFGGFTMRVARNRLSEPDQKRFDSYVGVTTWAPSTTSL
jgi:uncharacterized protein YegJ (DUF2314 family)